MQEPRLTAALKYELRSLGAKFDRDELAYLALTTKIELPIRDKLAYSLHRNRVAAKHYWVSREWKRYDIAVLSSNTKPKLLIELKAMYTFDMFVSNAESTFPNAMRRDREKLLRAANRFKCEAPEGYTLLLATHFHQLPDAKYDSIIKYAPISRRHNPGSLAEVHRRVSKHFDANALTDKGVITAGSAFGINVSVLYWLFGLHPRAA